MRAYRGTRANQAASCNGAMTSRFHVQGHRRAVPEKQRQGDEQIMSYWNQARMRATRRKSLWNLLLIPAAIVPWFAGWWLSASNVGHLYRMLHPQNSCTVLPDTIGGVLIAGGLLFAWCPIAMITGNVLVRAVPAARRALDQESSEARGTDFRSSNRGLTWLSAVLIPLGLGVSCIGLFL